MSSASIPVVFPPVEIEDLLLVDGGNFQSILVGDPIDRCIADGVEESNIIIDIAMGTK